MTLKVAHKRFTVEEFYRMGEAGIFTEDDRVELIEGEIIEMSPIGKRHAVCVARLTGLFGQLAEKRFIVWVQNPLPLNAYSEPQPDITLLKFRSDFYAQKDIEPADVLLIIEVSDTTLEYDREVKIPLYARAGIPESWVIDLAHEAVEVYSQPEEGEYRSVRTVKRGETLTPVALPDISLTVDDILG
ncbi:MAG: Uma2 family endonuclease [Calditrichaeota bacterium]|nr:MAG: Uma2 family endonuclease [Calditrichota bacterium]